MEGPIENWTNSYILNFVRFNCTYELFLCFHKMHHFYFLISFSSYEFFVDELILIYLFFERFFILVIFDHAWIWSTNITYNFLKKKHKTDFLTYCFASRRSWQRLGGHQREYFAQSLVTGYRNSQFESFWNS